MDDHHMLGLVPIPRLPQSQILCRLQKSFRWDYKPWAHGCKKDHIHTLKTMKSMSEFSGIWKHQTNQACSEGVRVFKMLEVGHHTEKEERRRIRTLLSQHWCRWGDAWFPEECWCQPSSAGPCAPWSAGPGSCGWSRCTWTWGQSHCNKTLCMHDMKDGRTINVIRPLSGNNHFCNSKDDQTVMRWWENVKERMRRQELFNSKTDVKTVVAGNNNIQPQSLLFKQMSQDNIVKWRFEASLWSYLRNQIMKNYCSNIRPVHKIIKWWSKASSISHLRNQITK